MRLLFAALCLAASAIPGASATFAEVSEAPCPGGTPLSGIVRDASSAMIPGASIAFDSEPAILTDAGGHFRLPCLPQGHHKLHITAESFAALDLAINTPHPAELTLTLQPSEVDTTLDVAAEDAGPPTSPTASGPAQTISGKRLQSLADDPDDLLRELQQMSAAAGGSPSNAQISVDGFQNGDGNTTLPPKSSIAYIKVNPDLFSAEYREPPFGGGQIEVYTKPGQSSFHGALFTTNSSHWMNARDPFSASNSSIGKQRYGFELTGPILKKGSDFTITLEHRTIDNVAAIYAATSVDSSGNSVYTNQTVPTPQNLFVGTARVDWQLGPKNTFIVSFSANHNSLQNLGVGGSTLVEAGYNALRYNNTLRVTDITTLSTKLMNTLRADIQWDGETDTPLSTAPSLSVAGAFTGGGYVNGPRKTPETDSEFEDDVILSTKNHLLKVGLDTEFIDQHRHLTQSFNGTYTFGGYTTASGTPVTALQQYFQSLNSQATPTDFNNVTGNPEVDLVQVRGIFFVQDDWKVLPNFHFSSGLRYFAQSDPTVVDALTPRFGLAWSPDKKATWNLHAHAGTFAGRFFGRNWGEILRMDGTQRVTNTVYNPTAYCPNGISSACNPLGAGATIIHSVRNVQPGLSDEFWAAENIGFTHAFPHGWNLSGDYYQAQIWHATRTENLNAPLNGSPTGPRPFGPNLNILQMQATGRGYGNAQFIGLEQHNFKHVQFFIGAFRADVVDDTDDNDFFTPQATGVNAGEYARRDNQPLWNVFGNATVSLPANLQLSTNLNMGGLQAYNITTGQDNNGDGDFQSRPRFAAAGTPVCGSSTTTACAYATPWGLLTNSGNGPTLSRDKGIMPWTYYLDMNLQRTFKITRNPKAEHPQTLSANIRSSNILNHENITAVGGVLGSPLFGQAYQADNGRRVEIGLRYAF